MATKLDGESAASLRDRLDQLKSRSGDKGDGVFVLASVDENNKVVLIAGVTAALSKTVKAGELVNHVATQVGGKGGGRPDMAQAGGSEPEKLDAALVSVRKWLESKLKN